MFTEQTLFPFTLIHHHVLTCLAWGVDVKQASRCCTMQYLPITLHNDVLTSSRNEVILGEYSRRHFLPSKEDTISRENRDLGIEPRIGHIGNLIEGLWCPNLRLYLLSH